MPASHTLIVAMDRAASVRRRDANGYLHVETSNISKANVCPYYGREIPDWQALGLQPDQVYQLYRDPGELERAAATFNNIPLLSEHVAVIPENGLPDDLIIGSTGTDAEFDGTYLRNSLVVWQQEAQDAIEADRKRELSCGYRYRADMTPGLTPESLRYDGVMREIMGNHVALVIEGRAGPDVVVGDDVMKLNSRTALMISGAIQSHVRPLLAADAQIDIAPALAGIDGKTFARKGAAAALAASVAKLVTPHLAADAAFSADALAAALSAIKPLALDEDKIKDTDEAEDEDDEDEDEDKPKGEDEGPEAEEDDDPKGAMDAAAVAKLVAAAERRALATVRASEEARRVVQPLVGEVALDSAEAIYAFALDSVGFKTSDIKGVPVAALKAMVLREADRINAKPIALDAAAAKAANDSFDALYGRK